MAMSDLNRNVVPFDLQVRVEAMYRRNRNHFRYMRHDAEFHAWRDIELATTFR